MSNYHPISTTDNQKIQMESEFSPHLCNVNFQIIRIRTEHAPLITQPDGNVPTAVDAMFEKQFQRHELSPQ